MVSSELEIKWDPSFAVSASNISGDSKGFLAPGQPNEKKKI